MQRQMAFPLPWKKVFIITCVIVGIALANIAHLPATAQRISPSDIWQVVYKELPELPKENTYISKDTGKPALENTLIGRLISYHIYVKGRAPIYRLDWKLTLADYLNANEIMYETSYPGSDSLKESPFTGDRLAISRLTRSQRNQLVQVLVNIFNPNQPTVPTPTPQPSQTPTTTPIRRSADFLK
ncbi:MAG TPA: hypothetical protein VK184_16630 [Nostocaceae cyanobacterium]|nr:hypothetical protein [Nostocaceae cyanobacterium]